MRLDTLVRLRWLAVIGQTAAVLVVHYGLDFTLPLAACAVVIAVSAWLNIALRVRFRVTQRLEPDRAAWLLAFDILQLAVAAVSHRRPRQSVRVPAARAGADRRDRIAAALHADPRRVRHGVRDHARCSCTFPLPWASEDPLRLPPLYTMGEWLALLLAIGFIGVYAWLIAEEARLLADALTATELVLAREKHLSQLDGLAAAAAHELATPLSTIAVVAKELERALGPEFAHAEDVRLLRAQTQRCREILAQLAELSADTGEPFGRMKLSTLVEEVVAPHRNFGIDIDVVLPADRAAEPVGDAQSGDPLRAGKPGRQCGRLRPVAGRGGGALDRQADHRSRSPTTGRAFPRRSWAGSASPT